MRTLASFALFLISTATIVAADETTLENVTTPTANATDEPLASSFSMEAAVGFLDQAALDWTKNRKCFTCHTNYAYLMARPAVSANVTAHKQVRAALEELVEARWVTDKPRWDAEVIMSAAVLAQNDSATSGELHATTRKALDRMWTLQREDGGFDWLKCGWPPMESDDDFGVAMALLATGAAPGGYAKTEPAQQGLEKIRAYLEKNPPPTLHHTAMLVWADSYLGGWLTAEQKDVAIKQLTELQKSDGGWALATLGNWQRGDGGEQDTKSSDGYATGFVLYILRRAGVPADDQRVQRGVSWLKANQRASGRWYTRSLNKDSKHFISHAGSAFAVLALTECDTLAAGK